MVSYYLWQCKNLVKKLYKPKNDEKQIVVYAAEEQVISEDLEFERLKKPGRTIDFVFGAVTHPTYEEYRKLGNLHLWSNFWLYKSAESLDFKNITEPTNKKLFISLNHRSHYHRCKLMDVIHKKKLNKLGIFSWHEINRANHEWEHWTPKFLRLRDGFEIDQNQETLPAEYNEAFINLVPESTVKGIFLTEKTWNAVLAAKPFIILGEMGIHQYLEEQGFQLYTELFDYCFDQEDNLEKRIDLITENLVRLANKDYNALYNIVKEKCIYNKKLALDIVRNQKGIPDKALKLNYYNNIVKDAQCRSDILESAN